MATGEINEPDLPARLTKLILVHAMLSQNEPWVYLCYDVGKGIFETPVMVNGDGSRFLTNAPLADAKALGNWASGFMAANRDRPGRYNLEFALVS